MPGEEEEQEEERRWTKSKFSSSVFFTLLKFSWTFRVDLTSEYLTDAIYKLFAVLCFVFLRDAPIPYVQEAILTLPDPYFEVLPYFKIYYSKERT